MNKTKIAIDIFNSRAADYQQKFMDVSFYHDGLDIFCNNLHPPGKVLDVACGPGNITKYILQKIPSLEITGIDLAPAMLQLATQSNPSAKFLMSDARQISSLNEKFNGIIAGFCFPYLSKEDALQFITDAASILFPQGVLYISTMEDDNTNSTFTKGSNGEEMFTNYHEAGYLTKALEENGFEIIALNRKIYSQGREKDTTDLIIIGKKV